MAFHSNLDGRRRDPPFDYNATRAVAVVESGSGLGRSAARHYIVPRRACRMSGRTPGLIGWVGRVAWATGVLAERSKGCCRQAVDQSQVAERCLSKPAVGAEEHAVPHAGGKAGVGAQRSGEGRDFRADGAHADAQRAGDLRV